MRIPKDQAALLVIDMQNGFVHPESGMGQRPGKGRSGTAAQQAIVPSILKLVERFRAQGVPVIWSQQEHFPSDKTREGRRILPHSARQGFLPCLRGTWETELYGPVREAVKPEDHLVFKHRASVFYNTNLEMKLRMLGTRFLFVTGCNTEFCVESTVREAYARDLEIVVVRDCVAGIDPRFHENSLAVFQAYFGEVISLDDAWGILE
jgi:ureidoacrylate peracid hydrolase